MTDDPQLPGDPYPDCDGCQRLEYEKREAVENLAAMLVATGEQLWRSSHNVTPAARRLFDWMREIAPGQLVLEVTNIRGRPIDCVGELIAIEGESEYTIRAFDGRERRWKNCTFVRLPRGEADQRELAKDPS